MKCKDCYHYDICPKWDDWNDRPYKDGYSDQCQNYSKFKDKLHIVELPCFFGDKVYFPYTGENYPQKLVLLKLNAVNVGEVVRFTTDGYGTHIRVQFRENGCTELTFYADEINKKVFFNKEKAEEKLKETKMKFKIEKVGNMIFITSDNGTVYNAWDEFEFTERKLNNAIKRITNNLNGNATFTRCF